MSAHFEIVRTDGPQPWHVRIVASNGKIALTSETYTRRRGALGAIAVALEIAGHQCNRPPTIENGRVIAVALFTDIPVSFDLREVDERGGAKP